MLKRIEGFEKFVEISGFRQVRIGDAKAFVQQAGKELPEGVEVQLFDADLIASWQHLYFAALNAFQAFQTKRSISKSLALETALYASAQRQIKKALDFIGVKPETTKVAVLVLGSNADSVEGGLLAVAKQLGAEPDETILDLRPAKVNRIRGAFDVSETELKTVSSRGDAAQALVDVVVERVALLSTRL
jgi:tRNA threonylcarbamoyladenosine modification (KEOPS) complex Cgi121 subunit